MKKLGINWIGSSMRILTTSLHFLSLISSFPQAPNKQLERGGIFIVFLKAGAAPQNVASQGRGLSLALRCLMRTRPQPAFLLFFPVGMVVFAAFACAEEPLALTDAGVGVIEDAGTFRPDASLQDAASEADVGHFDPISAAPLPGGAPVNGTHFASSQICADCHASAAGATALRDGAGRSVAPFDEWEATMMANSARDPLFRAVLSAEVARVPSLAAEIQAECLTCHAPMAVHGAALAGEMAPTHAELLAGTQRGDLGLDGVSCTVCHQIRPDGLGTDATFSGRINVGTDRTIFGPYAAPFAMPMVRRSGFTPVQGPHIRASALCGTCHTLVTHAVRPDGSPTGDHLEEQSPYLEWRASAFNDEGPSPGPESRSCQSCHMPVEDDDGAPIATQIARMPSGGDFNNLATRSPFGRHVFVGANTLVPALLRDTPELGARASAPAFDATITRARRQLEERTATLTIGAITAVGGIWTIPVALQNLGGHKLPTAYPSRRVFLRLQVFAADGRTLFVSGGFDARGRLTNASGEVLAVERRGGAVEPHHERIERDDQVQIYESVLGDSAGARTASLLAATRYLKDNRVLPRGYDAQSPDAARTRPVGVDGDPSFVGGADQLTYRLQLQAAPARVEVELFYQVLGARFWDELAATNTAAVAALQAMLERTCAASVGL